MECFHPFIRLNMVIEKIESHMLDDKMSLPRIEKVLFNPFYEFSFWRFKDVHS